jgi:ABC-type polar amino acid transport system ATPase subunit
VIKVIDLHKSFGDLQVLNGINNEIRKGEVVCIIGASGSGKSTFLRCLNLLEEPTKGEVIIDGISLIEHRNDINKLRQKVGMVFQQFNLFPHMTVMENITLGPIKLRGMTKEQATEKAVELLRKVGLYDKDDAYPNKMHP